MFVEASFAEGAAMIPHRLLEIRNLLDRLLMGRDAFVNVLAALASVNFGTRGCDCGSTHFDLTGLGYPA